MISAPAAGKLQIGAQKAAIRALHGAAGSKWVRPGGSHRGHGREVRLQKMPLKSKDA